MLRFICWGGGCYVVGYEKSLVIKINYFKRLKNRGEKIHAIRMLLLYSKC